MAAYTTSQLLTSIKTRAMLPDSLNGLSDTRLLELATEELQLELLQTIRSVREEFYVTSKDYVITKDHAAYVMPSRASGLVLRDVQIVTSSGVASLNPIAREAATSTTTGIPHSYYFEHNKVIVYPTPASTQDVLKLSYFFRPSALALLSASAAIAAIDPLTNIVSVSSIPSAWTTGTVVDFISQQSPYANVAVDYVISSVTGTDITFASLPDGLTIGDYICLAEFSCLPQVPVEFQVVLAQMTACRSLEALGQVDQLQLAEAKLKKYQDAAISFITPRNEGSNKKIVSNNWSNGRRW